MSSLPVTAAEREQMRRLHARGMSCNDIARELGRGGGTVSRHCKEMGLSFAREQTRAATAAMVADSRAKRAATSARFLSKCNELLDQMDQPYVAFAFGGRDNNYNEHLMDSPPVDALRSLMQAAATAYEKHMAQDRHDADDTRDLSNVDAWLAGVVEGAGH